jgi:hypothetical protein
MSTEDDEYEGYKFPARTLFTWNSFSIAMNPDEYDEPQRFWPERFINKDLNNVFKGHWSFRPGKLHFPVWQYPFISNKVQVVESARATMWESRMYGSVPRHS